MARRPSMAAPVLHLAFDRIDAFLAVQSPLSREDLGPILRLQAAAGVEEPERVAVRDRLGRLGWEDRGGAVLLGLLLGRFAAQFEGGP